MDIKKYLDKKMLINIILLRDQPNDDLVMVKKKGNGSCNNKNEWAACH